MEMVPTLPDDVITDQVSVVHRNALKFSVPPSANLLEQVMNVQPEHCRRVEHPDDIHSRNTVGFRHVGRDSNVAVVVGGSSVVADFRGGRAHGSYWQSRDGGDQHPNSQASADV